MNFSTPLAAYLRAFLAAFLVVFLALAAVFFLPAFFSDLSDSGAPKAAAQF